MKHVSGSMSAARLSSTPYQGGTPRSPIWADRGTIPSADMTLQIPVHNSGDRILFIYSFHASARNSILAKFRSSPVSTGLPWWARLWTKYRQIFGRNTSPWKHDTPLYESWSYCTVILYDSSGHDARRSSFPDKSISSVLYIFVDAVLMLPLYVMVSIEASLCITSDATSLKRPLIVGRVTVGSFFPFSFSSQCMTKTH